MLQLLNRFKWTLVYIALIPTINTLFLFVPTLPLPDGGHFTPLSILVGLVLVFRDFCQREIGHWVFIPLIIATGITFGMAGPQIAIASCGAFFISECVDWAVYSFTKKPLSARVMLSSIIAAPIDTMVFMLGASLVIEDFLHASTFVMMIASKLGGAYVVYRLLKKKEKREAVSLSVAATQPSQKIY